MFSFFCCKASEVSDKATELIASGQERVKAVADEFTLSQLRAAFIGHSTKVAEAPEVIVSVEDIVLKEGAGLSSMSSFSIKGLLCKMNLEVQGTAAQMAGMVAAQQTGKLFNFLAQGEEALTGALGMSDAGVAERAASTLRGARASLAESAAVGQERRVLSFDVVVDLVKVAGVEEVRATVVEVTSSHEAVNKVMSVGAIKKYVELAMSEQATQVVTEWQNKTFSLTRAKEHGEALLAAGKAKGEALIESGKGQGAALVDMATPQSLAAKGMVLGGALVEGVKAQSFLAKATTQTQP